MSDLDYVTVRWPYPWPVWVHQGEVGVLVEPGGIFRLPRAEAEARGDLEIIMPTDPEPSPPPDSTATLPVRRARTVNSAAGPSAAEVE